MKQATRSEEFELPPAFFMAATLYLIFAWSQHGYFWPDEQFQLLEFMMHKFYGTPGKDLAWEFPARMRPWLQPSLYGVICRTLDAIGIHNRIAWLSVIQSLTAVLGIVCLRFSLELNNLWVKAVPVRRFMEWVLCTGWFLPLLFSRYSSEALSSEFFFVAFAWMLLRMPQRQHMIEAAFVIGLACQLRYQTAFFVMGFALWLWFVAKWRGRVWFRLVAGFALAQLLCALIDCWGYDRLTFAPLNYFRVNVVNKTANFFGVSPWYDYFRLIYHGATEPMGVALIAGVIASWWFFPRNPLTWIGIPFVAAHFATPHKELRFFFPMAFPALLAVGLSLDAVYQRWGQKRTWPAWCSFANAAKLFVAYNLVLTLATWIKPLDTESSFYQQVYAAYPQELHVLAFDYDPMVWLHTIPTNFYRPKRYAWEKVVFSKEQLSNNQLAVLRVAWNTQREPSSGCKLLISAVPDSVKLLNFRNWMQFGVEPRLYECSVKK